MKMFELALVTRYEHYIPEYLCVSGKRYAELSKAHKHYWDVRKNEEGILQFRHSNTVISHSNSDHEGWQFYDRTEGLSKFLIREVRSWYISEEVDT